MDNGRHYDIMVVVSGRTINESDLFFCSANSVLSENDFLLLFLFKQTNEEKYV